MLGLEYDYLPLIHPKGYPQSIIMDYKNSLGKGSTALYWTCPRRQYFLYVDSSFDNWISNYVQMLENNLMKKDDLGKTTTFLNIDEIFKDYIHKNKGQNDEQD